MPDRVLVIDDEEMIRKGLKIHLDRAGFAVYVVGGGLEAFELIRREPIDVIVCDIKMPGINGFDLLDFVREQMLNVPVVVLTGLMEFEVTIRAMQKGAFDYLIKPVKKDILLVSIEKALRHRRLIRENRRMTQIETLFRSTFRLLLQAMERRPYGTGHSNGVCEYALLLADEIRLERNEKISLEHAALLHDIGMVTMGQDSIWNERPLTRSEWVQIRFHPIAPIFDDILEDFPGLKTSIRHHHERFDGTGYPDGLRGEAIPLLSRILAVADTYDSLTSDRPFRSRVCPNEAFAIMSREKEKQFDPFLMDAFCQGMTRHLLR